MAVSIKALSRALCESSNSFVVIKCIFSEGMYPPGERGPRASVPLSLVTSVGFPVPLPGSHCHPLFHVRRGQNLLSSPITSLLTEGCCSPHSPIAFQSLDPSYLQPPDLSNLEIPSSVQGFFLTPGFSHKTPCLKPISSCSWQCQACP